MNSQRSYNEEEDISSSSSSYLQIHEEMGEEYSDSPSDDITPMMIFVSKHTGLSEIQRNRETGGILRKKSFENTRKNLLEMKAKKREAQMSDYIDSFITIFFSLSFILVLVLILSSIIWWRMEVNLI